MGTTSSTLYTSRSRKESHARTNLLATSVGNVDAFDELSNLPEEVPSLIKQANDIENSKNVLPNPGLYENALNEVKSLVNVDAYDGFRFDFTRILGQKFSTSHSVFLGSSMIPGGLYQFGANVLCGDPMDPSTFLMSKITPDGFLDGRWNQQLGGPWKLRMKAQLKMEPVNFSRDASSPLGESQILADLDYTGQDFTWNMKLSNGPLYGISYFQSVTPQLALGSEAYYHAGHLQVIAAYCAKYTRNDFVASGTIGANGSLQLQYMRKIQGQRMRYATEVLYNHVTGESQTTIGGQFEIGASRLSMSVDQSGRIASNVESHVLPNFLLTLAAEAFPGKSDFKFGYGAQISF